MTEFIRRDFSEAFSFVALSAMRKLNDVGTNLATGTALMTASVAKLRRSMTIFATPMTRTKSTTLAHSNPAGHQARHSPSC